MHAFQHTHMNTVSAFVNLRMHLASRVCLVGQEELSLSLEARQKSVSCNDHALMLCGLTIYNRWEKNDVFGSTLESSLT